MSKSLYRLEIDFGSFQDNQYKKSSSFLFDSFSRLRSFLHDVINGYVPQSAFSFDYKKLYVKNTRVYKDGQFVARPKI